MSVCVSLACRLCVTLAVGVLYGTKLKQEGTDNNLLSNIAGIVFYGEK